jgi:MFS family permease
MFRTLMTSGRFAPLFWCQFFSAFNDNFVRNMLAMLILFRFGGGNASLMILLATIVFILPSIPLSALGGEIADSHDKALIARRLKFAEIFVQMIAAAGFAFASPALLYLALFGLGVIAALFGPIKYGILPDHLRRDELVSGNALVEGATFAAIICGLVFGGFAAAQGRSAASVAAQLMLIALACYISSRFIPPTGVGAPGLKVHKNVFASTWTVIREVRADDRQWVGAIGTSWFWTIGAVTLSLVPVIVKSRIGGGVDVEIAINLFFAVGIAAGSLAAAAFSHGRIELAPAPFPLARDRGARDRHGAFDRRDADREPRGSAHRILHERRGPAHRARDFRLFSRRRPVRRSDLRCRSGLGRRGPPRARRRRGQRPQHHLDGRRLAGDHGPVAGVSPKRADGAGRPRGRQYRGGGLLLPPAAGERRQSQRARTERPVALRLTLAFSLQAGRGYDF